MRKLYLASMMLALIVCLCSCSKNDDTTLDKNDLIGTWTLHHDPFTFDQITFNEDGTYVLYYHQVYNIYSRITVDYSINRSRGKFTTDDNKIEIVDSDGKFSKEVEFLGIDGDVILYYLDLPNVQVNPKQFKGKRIGDYKMDYLIGDWDLNTPYFWNARNPHFIFKPNGAFTFNFEIRKEKPSGQVIFEEVNAAGSYTVTGDYIEISCEILKENIFLKIDNESDKECRFKVCALGESIIYYTASKVSEFK